MRIIELGLQRRDRKEVFKQAPLTIEQLRAAREATINAQRQYRIDNNLDGNSFPKQLSVNRPVNL